MLTCTVAWATGSRNGHRFKQPLTELRPRKGFSCAVHPSGYRLRPTTRREAHSPGPGGPTYRADSEPAAPSGNRTECSPGRFEINPGGPGAPFGGNLAQFSAASLILKKSAPSAQPCAGAAGTTTRAGAWKHVPFAQPGRPRGAIRQGTPPVDPLAGFGGDFAEFEFSYPASTH